MTDPAIPPIHVQISEMLLRQIAAGRLVEGERLPPEREMATEYGVAVGTLRRALAELTERGVIARRQGSGNYVRKVRDVAGLYGFFRLELVTGGGQPSARVLDLATRPKPGDAPDFGARDTAQRIRRLRLLDGIAVALEEIWFDGGDAALDAGDVTESLYQTYRVSLGIRVVRVEDRCGVSQVPDWGAERLSLPPGAPCGHVERLSWSQTATRVEYSRTWFDHEKARYVSRLK